MQLDQQPETPAEVSSERPSGLALFRSYPNPFNATTTLVYDLAAEVGGTTHASSSSVTLTVVDLLGRTVATFQDAPRWPGRHSVTFDAAGFPSGTYYAVLTTPVATRVISMMLLR